MPQKIFKGVNMKALLILTVTAYIIYAVWAGHKLYNTDMDPYSNENLHKWAAAVIDHALPADRGGYYDICIRYESKPMSKDFLNACAIMRDGGEW